VKRFHNNLIIGFIGILVFIFFGQNLVYAQCGPIDVRPDGDPQNAVCDFAHLRAENAGGGNTGTWTTTGGALIPFADINDRDVNVSQLDLGNNTFTWTVTDGGGGFVCSVSIVLVGIRIEAEAGPNQPDACASTTLAADNPAPGTGLWTVDFGNANFGAPTSHTSGATNLDPGNNTLRWTVTNAGCVTFDVVSITNNTPVAVDAGTDDEACINNSITLGGSDPGLGKTGQWSVVTGNGTFANASIFNTVVSGMDPGLNEFRWEVTHTVSGCFDNDQVQITNNTVVASATDQTVCGTTATLDGNNPIPLGATGLWTVVTSTGSITTPAQYNTGVTNLNLNANTFNWELTKGICSDVIQITITRTDLGPDAGPDQNICSTTATMAATGTGVWSIVGGGGTITIPGSSVTTITSLLPGENIFQWTVTQGPCSGDDLVSIFNDTPSTSNAGVDNISCDGTFDLSANNPVYGTGQWTAVPPGAVFTNDTEFDATVSGLSPGLNTLTWTITNGACVSISNVGITYDQLPVITAGPDQQDCIDNYILAGTDPNPTGTGIWTVVQGTGTFTDPTAYNTPVTLAGNRDNTYRWTVTVGGCSASDDVIISNYGVTANAGLDDYTCDGIYNLSGNNPTTQDIVNPPIAATGTWTALPAVPPIAFSNINNFDAIVSDLELDVNTLTWTIDNGFCSDFDEVEIRNDMPTLPNAGNDSTFCGTDYQSYSSIYTALTANAPDLLRDGVGEVGYWTQVAGTSTFLDPTTSNVMQVDDLEYYAQLGGPDFWNLNPTVNTYRWTIDYKNCSLYDEVTITNAAPFDALAGDPQTVCWYEADLNATDLGRGAQDHWWVATPSTNITFYDPLTSNVVNPQDMPFNSHVDSLQIGATTFRWYKENIINGVTCTIWNETVVTRVATNIGETTAGTNQVVCSREATMSATDPAGVFVAPPVYNVTGEWSVLSGAGSFASISSPSTLVSALGYTTNILRWTITNHDLGNCLITNDVYITNALPSDAVAGPDQNVCDSSALLSAVRPTRGVGTWSVLGGGATISNTTCVSFNCNVYTSNMGTSLNTFLWTTSYTYTDPSDLSTETCELTDTVKVWNNMVTIDGILDQTVCIDDATLAVNPPGAGESGIWVVTGGGGTATTPTLYNSPVTGLTPNLNSFRWTLSNAFCSDSDQMSITNNNPTDPIASTPIPNVCTDVATLNGNNPLNGAGRWDYKLGGGVITNATLNNTTVTSMPVGLNEYWYIIEKVGCADSTFVQVNNRSVTANAGANDTICGIEPAISTVNLNAIPPSAVNNETGNWTVFTSIGTIVTPTLFNTQVTGMDNGANTFRWTISNGTCSASDFVEIFVNIPTTAVANPDYEACANPLTDNITLTANAPAVGRGVGTWTKVPPAGGTINDNTANITTVSFPGYNENTYRWTIDLNGCTSSDDIVVTNNFVESDAGLDDAICTDTYTLSGNDPTVNDEVGFAQASGQWSVTQGTAVFVNDTQYDTDISGLSSAIANILRWTVTKGGCSDFDEVTIVNNEFTVTANVDQTVCDDFTTLNGQQPGVGESGLWTINLGGGSFVDNTLYNTVVNGFPVGSSTYRWTITNADCSASDDVEVYYNYVLSNAGTQQRVCSTTALLDGNSPPVGGGGTWTSTGGAIATTPSFFNSVVTNLDPGQNELQWTVSNTINTVTCNHVSSVYIYNDTPDPAVVEADNEVCTNSTDLTVVTPPAVGTGVWTAVDNVAIFDNSLSFNPTVTGLNRGINTFRWTVTNQACTSIDNVIITNNTVISDADIDKSTACADFTTLSGNDPTLTQGTGVWVDLSASGATIVNNTLYNTSITGLPQGTTQFQWTVSLGTCSASDVVEITNNQITATAGVDQTICNDFYSPLDGNDVSGIGGTGLWTSVGLTADITNATLFNTGVTNLDPGLNTFRWTVTSGVESCTDFAEVGITNNGVISNAGSDIETCNASINLSAVAPTTGAGTWTQASGAPATIVDATNRQSLITGLTGGVYAFTWIVVNGACSASDDVVVTNSTPVVSNPTTPTPETCDGTGVLQANAAGVGESGVWSGGAGSTIADVSANNTTASGMPLGVNTYTWTLTKGTNVTCISANSIIITNNEVVASAGVDKTTLCNDFVTLSGNDPTLTQGNGIWTDQSGSTATIVNNTLYSTLVTNVEIGTTTFRWTVSQGTCSANDDVIITNNQITASAGVDQATCDNFYNPLDGNDVSVSGGTGVWSTTGTGTFVDDTQFNTRVDNLQAGINTLTWTVTSAAEGCTDNDNVIITYNGVTADAGTDIETCNSNINLSAIAPAIGTGSWTQTGGAPATIVTSTDRQSSITGLTGGVYSFTWTVVNGVCNASDVVVVTNSSPTVSNPTTATPESCDGNGVIQANAAGAGETGLWSGGAGSTIADVSANNTTVSGMPLGVNTYIWTLTKGTNVTCISANSVNITNNQVIANAGSDNTTSCNDFVTLSGNNPILTQGAGLWTDQSGSTATIANNTLYNTVVNNVEVGATTFRWTVSLGTCSASDDVVITNNQITANAGIDQSTCSSTYDPLDGNDVSGSGGTGVWSTTGTGTFVDDTQYNTRVDNLQTGLNTLTWTVTSTAEGCVDSDDVVITNNAVTANAGSDIETCNSSLNLSAIAPSLGTGSWTQTGGAPVAIANSTDRQSLISGLAGGVYSFTWTVVNGVCITSDVVNVTNSSPSASNPTTPTPEVCDGNGTLQANAPAAGESGMWSLFNATGTFGDPTLNNTTITGLKPGTNTLRWTLTKGTGVTCTSFADVDIVNNEVTANAFTSNNISCDATGNVTGNNPGLQSATGLWTVSTGATISNTTYYNNVSVTNLAQGANIFTWTVSKGTCFAGANVTINNDQVFATVGGNIDICVSNVTLNGVDPTPDAGIWTLESGDNPASISIVTPTLYNTNVTGITKTAIFKWVVSGTNCKDSAYVTVNNNSIVVNDGPQQTICSSSGSLNAGSLDVGQTGEWTAAGSNPIIASSTNPITNVTNLDNGTNIFFWTVTNPTGCTGIGQYDIINDSPSTANAGVDQDLCASTASLSGNAPVYGTGIWTQAGGAPATIVDPTNSSTVVNGIDMGASTFTWTISTTNCTGANASTDNVIINNNLFTVTAGIDKNICTDVSSLNVVTGVGGVWTRISGTGIITDSTDPNTAVTNLSFGQNRFEWTVTQNGCTVSDQMDITNNSPETPVTEADKTVCQTDNVSISANAPSYGSGMWTPQGGTAIIVDATNNNTFVNNLVNGANTIRWTLTFSGCSESNDLVITSNAVTATAGNDQALCANNTTLSAFVPTVGIGSWSVTSGPAIITDNTLANSTVTNLGQGDNILRWTVVNVGCSDFDEVTITNNSPDVADAGLDINTCNSSVNLIGNNPAVGTGLWSTLSGTATILNPTLYNTSVTITPGITTFTWTITNGVCTSADDVEVNNESFIVNVNPDDVTCDGTYSLLGTNPADVGTGTGTGVWTTISGTGVFDNSLVYNANVSSLLATGSRESIFQWTITDGLCTESDVVKITNDEVSASGNGFMTCNSSTSITANDASLLGATGLWTVDNQTTQVVSQSTSFITNVSGLVPNAVNRFRWTVSRNTCSATDTVNVEYFVPNANITIPDIAHGCSDTVQLIADPSFGTGVGQWTEKFGSLQVTIDDNTATTTIARNLELGDNVFVWTVTDRGCVSTDEVTINNSLPVNTAGSDQAACNNAFTMNAQVPTATGNGLWTLISGTVSFVDNTLATTAITASPGSNIVQWTITDNGCSSSKQFTITNNLTNPNAGTDVDVCENRVQLSGSSLKPGESGVWSIDGGIVSEIFSSTSVNNPEVTSLRQGIITFVWTVTNGICSAEDRVVVTNNTPTVNAGPDRSICEDYVTLAGNNPDPGDTGLWTIGSGSVNIVSSTAYNTNVTNLSQGSNLFTWTIDNGICTASDDVLITSNAINVVAGIPYTEDCADTLYLEATVPPIGTTGFWTAVVGGGTFDNITSYTTVGRSLTGYNMLRWTIDDGTCTFFDEIEFVSLLPTQAATQADKAVCTDFTQITANPEDTGQGESGLWTKVVGSAGVTIVDPTAFQTDVTNLDPGVNVFQWTISNASCNTSDQITITNNQVFADAGNDQVICDSSATISANVTTGTGYWTSTTPGVVIANSTSPNSAVSSLAFGNNNFQWNVTYNSCNDQDEVIIVSNLPRNVSAGADQNICTGSTNLSGTNPGTGTGLWTLIGGNGTFATETANQTVVSGLSVGNNIFRWTVTVGSCSEFDEISVANNSIYVTAGTDQTLCNQDTLVLDGTIPGVGISGAWTVNGGSGTFDNASIYNTTVRGFTKGTNTYVWTLTDGSCTNFAEVEVIVNTPDSAKVGADQFICADNTTINAVSVTNGTGQWSLTSGSGEFADASNNNTAVTAINVGLNTYTWTVTKNGCSLAADVDVTNNSVIAYIGNDEIVTCTPTHTETIIGNAVGFGETGYWTKISSGPGVITTSTSNVTTVTSLGNGDTYFRWTVENGSCSSSDDLRITNNYYNTTASAAGPTTLCVDYSPIIGGSLPIGATGLWTSTAPDVTFDNNTNVSTTARNLPGGTSAITWTVTKDGCSSPASFNLLNNAIYTSAGADRVVCIASTSLNAQGLLPGESGVWTVDNASVVITNTADPATAVSGLITGDNTFTWTLTGNGCTVSDDVRISSNVFGVLAGVDQINCGTSFNLAGSDPKGGTGLWTIASGTGRFIDPTNFETLVEDMDNGPNTFTWTVSRNGCVFSADVTIINDLYIATAGDDRSICSDQTTVSAQPLNPTWGASGMWTAQTGGGVFTSPSLESTLVTGLSSGDNRLRWTVTKGACVSFDEIIITNNSITASAGTDETTCNDYATLSATPLSATGVGLWTGGGAGLVTIVDPTSATTSVTNLQQGVNTFAWTVTDNGCTGTSTVRITSNFFVARAGNDQVLTVSNATMTAQLPDVTATGTWSVVSGNGTFTNPNDPVTVVTGLGFGTNTFRWAVDWNSCTAYDDVDITYNVITADAGNDTTLCTDRYYLNAADPWPGTGVWSVVSGGGTFDDENNRTTQVTGITPGSVNIYRWTVTISGYSESDDVVVTNGEFEISAGLNRASCNDYITMAAEPAGSNGVGVWTVLAGAGNFADLSASNSSVTNLGSGTNIFQWTVTKNSGCVDSDLVEITYNVPPIANFDVSVSDGCSPLTVEYTNMSTSGFTYYWNFGEDQQTDNSLTIFEKTYIAINADSVYTTTLIAYSAAGCSDTISRTITAYGIPNVEFEAYPAYQIYPDATINIDNNSDDGYANYYWNYGDGETRIDTQKETGFPHTYPTWGEYTITLAVNSGNCDDSVRQTVVIAAPQPQDQGGRFQSGCQPLGVNLVANVLYADTYHWDIFDSDGTPVGVSDEENPSRILDEAGRYYAVLSVIGPGGTIDSIRIDTIDVNPVPVVDFIVSPDTVMLPNQAVHAYNRSTHGDFFEWDFGDGTDISQDENPLHYYTEEGEYKITLRVYTVHGCFNDYTQLQPIVVEAPGVCVFPNAFSPNPAGGSDGRYNPDDVSNDIFHPVYRGVREYKLEIFNRWGEKIFESLDPGIGWDGHFNGKLAPQDVYVWKVTGKFKNGVIFKKAGDVTLLQ